MITINDQINTIHRAIKILAGVCDHAETVDGNGFNGGDAAFGHSLADKETLTPRMAISGLKMLKKYHGQLGPVIMEQLNQIDPNALEDAPKPQPKQNGKELAPDQPLDIPTLLPWSEVKVVGGDKKVRSASINDNFWAAWASHKPELQAAGISVSKYQGQWQASWWQTPRAQSPAVAAAPVEVKVMTVPVDVAGKCLSYQVAGAAKLATGLKTYNVALDASDTGTGKTYMALAACKVLGLRPFVLCPKAVIPSWRKAAKHFGMEMGLACNYEFVKTGKTHSVKMTKVTGKKKIETHFTWDVPSDAVLVFDEVHRCFPADTIIETIDGLMTIGQIVENRIQTKVLSRKKDGCLVYRKIVGWFNNPASPLVKIKYESGELICTGTHRIWTENRGYVEAASLEKRDMLVLRKPVYKSQKIAPVLLEKMFCKSVLDAGKESQTISSCNSSILDGWAFQNSGLETNEGKQSCTKPEDNGHYSSEAERANFSFERRQLENHGSTTTGCRDFKSANGIPNRNKRRNSEKLSIAAQVLQGRYSNSRNQAGDRNRRCQPQHEALEVSGPTQGENFELSRVVSVEVQKSGSGQRSENSHSNDCLYDIEVEGTHNYFAEGILVSNCKAKDSQNAELLIAAKRSGRPVLMLSATAASDPLQMRALAYTLGLYQTEKGFWSWATKNGCKKGRFGFEFVGGKDAIKKLHHEIFDSGKGNRMRIANLPDFPQTSIHAETVEMDNADEIAKAYSDMEYELSRLAEVQAKDRQAIILTEILRARQKSEILKVPTLVEMVTDAIEEGMSVAVFVNFDASIDSLATKLQTKCFIRGGQLTEEREANIQAFQRGNFPRLSLICPTFSAQDLKQCVGRVWRAFDKNENPVWSNACSRIILCNIKAGGVGVSLHHLGGAKSIQKIVFAAGTIEEDAAASVERKIDNIDMLNDGDLTSGIKILSDEMQKQLL